MRKFVAVGLVTALLVLFGCGGAPIEQETIVEPTTIAETTTEEPMTEAPEEEPEEYVPPNWYPYTEFDEILQPGFISVNELAKRFGEPVNMTGELIAFGFGEAGGNVCGLTVEFKEATFELWDDVNGIRLSYNTEIDGTGTYEEFSEQAIVKKADKALSLELARFTVTGENVSLPRGIHIGDSLEKVLEAYPDEGYREAEDGEQVLGCNYYNKVDEEWIQKSLSYYPEWDYGIVYYFTDGELTRARLTWFNGWARFD